MVSMMELVLVNVSFVSLDLFSGVLYLLTAFYFLQFHVNVLGSGGVAS